MDSLSFSQADLGTQGEGPCFMVMNSQVEDSQEAGTGVTMSNAGAAGSSKQRMLWELAALRGTQPSPVLTTGGHGIVGKESCQIEAGIYPGNNKEFKGRTSAGSQSTDQPHPGPNQADDQQGNAAGDDGAASGGQGQEGQGAAGGAAPGAGGGGEDGSGGGEGGGGDEEDEDDEEEEETGEETSQEDGSNHSSSVPKLVSPPPPALGTLPRIVRIKEIMGGTEAPTSPERRYASDDELGSGRGGGVSDAPTAVVGDSTDEGQGAVTTPSPPRELSQRQSDERTAGGAGLMDPPLHSQIFKKRGSSDASHSSMSSSLSSRSSNSSLYLASHDSSTSRSHGSLSSSLSSGDGVQATSLMYTQIKEHPPKSTVLLPPSQHQDVDSMGREHEEQPQSSQQDLFSDIVEERKADYYRPHQYHQPSRVQVLANETSTSDDASIAVVPPSPEAYQNGIQDTPPDRIDDTLRPHPSDGGLDTSLQQPMQHSEGLGGPHQPGDKILVNETSTSDDASITIIQPSPEAWGTVIANTPPEKIEQYSRSTTSSAKRDSERTPSTPSETLGSLHLSGQRELTGSEDSISSVVPPTLDAYGPVPHLTPSTPSLDEEEPMELSFPEESEEVALTTHPPKRQKSAANDEDEYRIPEWQQVLNQAQQAAVSRSSSRTSSSSKTTSSSSETSGRTSAAQWEGEKMESFQAWQPSSQLTTSTTSEEPARSRPLSAQAKPGRSAPDASGRDGTTGEVPEKPRSVSAAGRTTQKSVSQPSRDIQGLPTTISMLPAEGTHPLPEKPPPTTLDVPRQRSELPTRRSQAEKPSAVGTSQQRTGQALSSLALTAKEKRREEEVVVARGVARGSSSEEWMLHYTPTQTETDPEAIEEGTVEPLERPSRHQALAPNRPAPATPSGPHHHEAAPSAEPEGETAHTMMSYADATTTSDTKKKAVEEDIPEGHIDMDVATKERLSMPAPVPDSQAQQDNPQQRVSLAIPGVESQSTDPTECSSIAFHLSLPRDGGFRPVDRGTLPPLANGEKKRSSSRQPIRHSTPRADQSPERQGVRPEPTTGLPAVQDGAPKLAQSSTLTLGAGMEPDTQEGTETPVFQLDRPADASQLLKAAQESPSKKSTSVFTKVQETKMASSQAKSRGQTSAKGTTRCSQSEDPFALSQGQPVRTLAQEDAPAEPEKQAEAEDEDDEETIPVCYQEGETAGRKEERRVDKQTAVVSKRQSQELEGHQLGRRKPSERTPEKGRGRKPGTTPSSSSRLTRSGQKRKLYDNKPEEKGRKKGGAAKKTRFEEPELELSAKPSGNRDPYDFSDSQSNKTPSPLKKHSHNTGAGPTSERHKTEDDKQASSPAQEKTPPVAQVIMEASLARSATEPARTTPKTRQPLGGKSAPTLKPSSSRGRRASTGRQRSASQHVLQTQLDEDSSPDFQPDQPREKAGVKFRRSPRKKSSQKQDSTAEKGTTSEPPPPRKLIVRRTTVYRVAIEEIIIDGKLVKTWETREQIEPVVETIEDEDSLDLPSPTRSVSSLTSGSLGDISSMYSKTSSSTPSLVRTFSGSSGILSKHSSFSSISRTGSSLSKQTVSSPGSDKSTPTLNKSVGSPGSDRSPGKEKTEAGVPSPGVGSSASPRRVSFTRSSSKPSLLKRVSSGSSDKETLRETAAPPQEVFHKPQQTPRRKVDQQQNSGFAQRLSSLGADGVRSPEERRMREGPIPVAKVAKLVQMSQDTAPAGKDASPSPTTPPPSTSPLQSSRLSRRRSSRASALHPEQDTARGTTKNASPASPSPARLSTPPQESTRPATSEPSTSYPRNTLFEPPAGETLPVAEGEASLLLPGLKVYTKWLDGFWYPGTIFHQDKVARYVIEFDDGDHRTVNERDIIIKEWLSRGQCVMAEDADGFYYAGVVVGYYRDPDTNTSGYVIEQTVSHQTSRYERRLVILTKDQAATLVSSASSSSSTSGTNISLDNVLYNKRTRLRSRLLDSPGAQQPSPKGPQKTTPTRQAIKRKLVPSDEQQKQGAPLLRKRGRPATHAAAVPPSPEPSTSPRRSPRKHQQQQGDETHAMAVHMGPLPKQTTMFRNHAFLVTHGEVRKPPAGNKTSSSEESGGEDEVEIVPFDRNYAIQQILKGGGVVLSDFDKSQITKMKVFLIANTYCRTKKYFQALAASIPCISHLWLRQCCISGRLENHKSYLLPAGESLEENALMEIQPNCSILTGMRICMVSDYEGIQDTWRSILIAAGCHVVARLPSHHELTKNPDLSLDCNVIVTDPSCPRSLLHRARQLDIPVVSYEWVIQCLINGVRVPYRGHEKYDWKYRDKPTK